MAKNSLPRATTTAKSVTPERAARLFRLLRLLESGPQTRALLIRRLQLDVRGFYRDLEYLRGVGVQVVLRGQRYALDQDISQAFDSLPFPDPSLTLGEARILAKGKTAVHKRIQSLISQVVT